MFGIPENLVIPIINVVGIGLLGLLAALGHRWGKSQPTPAEKTLEVAGALVDAKAVHLLAAAIEAINLAAIEDRKQRKEDGEKARKLGYALIEAFKNVADELGELRRDLVELRMEIARRN